MIFAIIAFLASNGSQIVVEKVMVQILFGFNYDNQIIVYKIFAIVIDKEN